MIEILEMNQRKWSWPNSSTSFVQFQIGQGLFFVLRESSEVHTGSELTGVGALTGDEAVVASNWLVILI